MQLGLVLLSAYRRLPLTAVARLITKRDISLPAMSHKSPSRASIDKETSPKDINNTHIETALESTKNALGEETAQVTDHAAEMRLTWKLDTRLLVRHSLVRRQISHPAQPVLAFMYLCNALDKGNLGNAKTDHMDTDLGTSRLHLPCGD